MIYGIGTDICDIRRIERALALHSDRFAAKILGTCELLVYESRSKKNSARGVRYLATRFAAKEAFSKAIGLGMHHPMWWTRCEILKAASGAPQVALRGELADWCAARNLNFHVSITDEADTAVAFVVAEVLPLLKEQHA
jgi:holo-[acyl-carrier protein] synthase